MRFGDLLQLLCTKSPFAGFGWYQVSMHDFCSEMSKKESTCTTRCEEEDNRLPINALKPFQTVLRRKGLHASSVLQDSTTLLTHASSQGDRAQQPAFSFHSGAAVIPSGSASSDPADANDQMNHCTERLRMSLRVA